MLFNIIDLNNIKIRMNKSLIELKNNFNTLRTGQASSDILDNIYINVYNKNLLLKELSTISVINSYTLKVSVWDTNLIAMIDKSIRNSNLGLNPIIEGKIIKIPLPPLSQERRQELIKIANKYTEQTRIAIRNIRRNNINIANKALKSNTINEDNNRIINNNIQKITNEFILKANNMLKEKEKNILDI